MVQLARWRVILVAAVTVIGILFALPNFLPAEMRERLPGLMPRQALNLGLDLRGGVHLLLQVDTATMRRQQLENVADQMGTALREAEPAIRYGGRGVVADAARIRLNDPADLTRARAALREVARSPTGDADILSFTEGADGVIEARISPAHMRELSRQAAQQSIEVIRRRIDPTGTSEVSIQRQGDDRIVVQAPGLTDPQQLKSRIGQTALMTFHMVREADPSAPAPPGTMLVQPYPGIADRPEIVERRPRFTGERLTRASPSTDGQTGQIVMSFQLDSQGARQFCSISRQYTGQRFAILLDNQVLTAPTINEPICGGSGQISGNFNAQSASELAVMLRAGALPAPLTVIEERSVGPGLGQDSIDAGIVAGIVSGVGVLLFMALAYGLFGLFACIALLINGILILAAMSMIGAALTLPGIAGLILTLAMAVDANVLIYERMRDEQKAGRSPAISIDAGFGKAMVAIIDANLTTILAALILFQFGAGPVRGFAWTLSIGVITSVFTAVLVTQILIAWWYQSFRPKKLPI
jgi:protein-export membrane protein SecD